MINALFLTRGKGTSKKTGNAYYFVNLYVPKSDGGHNVVREFINASLFHSIETIQNLDSVGVELGYDDYGRKIVTMIQKTLSSLADDFVSDEI